MVRGKKIEGIDDTPDNVAKAMVRQPIRRYKRGYRTPKVRR